MKISVIGCGYVGLVSGTCIANLGNDVVCVDINESIIKKLNKGEIHIYEPGLSELIKENTNSGRLKFTVDLKEAVEDSEIIFLAVNTPQEDNGEANLNYIFKAAEEVGKLINTDNKIIACKSTVPPGTGKKIEEIIKKQTNKQFYVVSVPEFLAEGRAIEDFQKPDRIVLGCDEDYPKEKLNELFEPYARKETNKIILMSRVTAELTKYAANSMLASRVSLMNEISAIADMYGADITKIRIGLGSDRRIGKEFLFPGPGFGGSCFPKDVSALAFVGSSINPVVLQAILERNILQKQVPFNKLKTLLGPITGKTIAILGLSFKANTDDVRESPSIDLVKRLISHGAIINLHDPQAMPNFKKVISDDSIRYFDSVYDSISGAHGLIIMTDWNQFRNPDHQKIFNLMSDPKVIIDCRNLWHPERIRSMGFKYDSIGRP